MRNQDGGASILVEAREVGWVQHCPGTFPSSAYFLGLQCPQMGQVAYPLNTFRGRHSWCPEDMTISARQEEHFCSKVLGMPIVVLRAGVIGS